MRAVVQRVKSASVDILENGARRRSGEIGRGLVVLLAVENGDTPADAEFLAAKIAGMRIFEDSSGKMNLSVVDCGGGVLLVSQFTLFGNMRKGNRPSFNRSAPPPEAIPLYEKFSSEIFFLVGGAPQRGVFGAMMDVSLVNDGPVTIILDSRNKDI